LLNDLGKNQIADAVLRHLLSVSRHHGIRPIRRYSLTQNLPAIESTSRKDAKGAKFFCPVFSAVFCVFA